MCRSNNFLFLSIKLLKYFLSLFFYSVIFLILFFFLLTMLTVLSIYLYMYICMYNFLNLDFNLFLSSVFSVLSFLPPCFCFLSNCSFWHFSLFFFLWRFYLLLFTFFQSFLFMTPSLLLSHNNGTHLSFTWFVFQLFSLV